MDNANKICRRKKCTFKHPWRDEMAKVMKESGWYGDD